jgi:hypothetical protein
VSFPSTSIAQPRISQPLRQAEETQTSAANEGESTFSSTGILSFETVDATSLAPVIDIDRLYDAEPGSASHLVRALELLKQAIDFLSEARISQDPIDSDRFVQRAQVVLPRLFSYRSIGDGFGVTISSLFVAFTNLRGTPLSSAQLNAVWRILRELRARPAMSLEQGIRHAQELENCGLEVDPPELADVLEGQESEE